MKDSIQLNKTASLATMGPDATLSEFKRRLNREGLYFGYHPMEESEGTVADYAARRVPNLYHFKYGGMGDMVSTMTVELKAGGYFRLKSVPRAATGPDFNRFLVGSEEAIARVKDITVRVAPVPDRVLCGVAAVPSREAARRVVTGLIGIFVRPLFFRYFDLETAAGLPGLKKGKKKEPSEALILSLAGMDGTVTAEKEIAEELFEKAGAGVTWLEASESHELMKNHVFRAASYSDIHAQYREFVWTPSDPIQQRLTQKKFLESLNPREEAFRDA